jgi:hypothetical protein
MAFDGSWGRSSASCVAIDAQSRGQIVRLSWERCREGLIIRCIAAHMGEDILAQKEADQQIEREKGQGGKRSGLSRQVLARRAFPRRGNNTVELRFKPNKS